MKAWKDSLEKKSIGQSGVGRGPVRRARARSRRGPAPRRRRGAGSGRRDGGRESGRGSRTAAGGRRCRRAGGPRRRRRAIARSSACCQVLTMSTRASRTGPGPVVELDRAADIDAARVDLDRDPLQPAVEQRAQPRQAARRRHRRAEHLFLELGVVLADDRDLQLLARAEVGEDARLAHPGDLGQGADRQPFEADVRRERERGVDDRGARLRPFISAWAPRRRPAARRRCRRRENPRKRADAAIGQKRTIVLFCRKTAGRGRLSSRRLQLTSRIRDAGGGR